MLRLIIHLLCLMLFSCDYNRWFFYVIFDIVFIYFADAITFILVGFLMTFGGLSINICFTLTTSSQVTREIIAEILQSSNIVVRHRRFCTGLWGLEEACFIWSHGSVYLTGILDASISRRSSKVLVAWNIRIDTNRALFTGGTNEQLLRITTIMIIPSDLRGLIYFISSHNLFSCIRKSISLSTLGFIISRCPSCLQILQSWFIRTLSKLLFS